MQIYLITYDLKKPGQDYTALYDLIKSYGDWWHFLDSTWLIYTSENANQICNKLKECIDSNDYLLITKFGSDYQGRLPQKAWDWIKDRIKSYSYV